MNVNGKKIKTEREISAFLRKSFFIGLIFFVVAMGFAFLIAKPISHLYEHSDNINFAILLLSYIGFAVSLSISHFSIFRIKSEMEFVPHEYMLKMSDKVESFPDIKALFCEIVSVRPLLTIEEYELMDSKIKEAKKQRDASIWELKKKSICS